MPEQLLLAKDPQPHSGPSGRPGAGKDRGTGSPAAARNRRVLLRAARALFRAVVPPMRQYEVEHRLAHRIRRQGI
ncbi:hypothetical protein ABZ590_38265, partial [Streptomyces hirsutus]